MGRPGTASSRRGKQAGSAKRHPKEPEPTGTFRRHAAQVEKPKAAKAGAAKKKKAPPPSRMRPRPWRAELTRKRNGDYAPTRANIGTIVQNLFERVFGFNELTGLVTKLRKPKWHWRDMPAKSLRKKGSWTDDDTLLLTQWLERSDYELSVEPRIVRDVVRVEARRNAFHPIRDWLRSLEWDRRPRLDSFLVRHAQVTDSPYVRAVTSKWIVSAAARAFRPGVQVDHVLILEGQQRSGKTSLLRMLTGNPEWFLTLGSDLHGKEVYSLIRGKWIGVFEELDSLNRTEWTRVKSFITDTIDTYRRPYATDAEDQPRTLVLAGTTNECNGGYLRDQTGNGRFWPVSSAATVFHQVNFAGIASEREQIWAEATQRYLAGEPWHLTDPEILRVAIEEQDARRERDIWEPRVHMFLRKSTSLEKGVTVQQIADFLGLQVGSIGRIEEMRIGKILTASKWTRQRTREMTGRKYRYFPPS